MSTGVTVEDIARFLGTYTIDDNMPDDDPDRDRVPEARLQETVFAGAFSTEYLAGLSDDDIEDFGAGEYPEGTLEGVDRK